MANRNIFIASRFGAYIEAKIASGEYADESDVVRYAMRLMIDKEVERLESAPTPMQRMADRESREKCKIAGDEPVTMKNVSLPPEIEEHIEANIEWFGFADASEVVCYGLCLMSREDTEKIEWLRNAIREGLESPIIDKDIDEIVEGVKRRGRERLAAMQRTEKSA